MLELRARKSIALYGENVWSNADIQTKACFNFLCGNHTRNLPVVRFNKVRLSQHLTLTLILTLTLTLVAGVR